MLVTAVLVVTAVAAPPVSASVEDQRQKVEQIADQLDALENQIGQLEEDYAGAQDRIDQLTEEIAVSQAKVDAQQAELGQLQGQMTSIAVDKFTSGGSTGLTPLFSTAEAFTEELQRGELSRVALDQGAGTSDEMEALVDDLAAETASLESKKSEQAALMASLEEQRVAGEALVAQYEQDYAAAQAELGDLIVQEQERRAAAAIAAAQQAAQNQQMAAPAPARGGGAAAPAPAAGAGDTGGGGDVAAPAPAPVADVPPPSSTSGIAVNAAMGQLGVPSRFAAESPGVAFDCSGLTKYAWGRAGVYLPHQSAAQYASTPHVPKDQAQPGDLIFYYSPIGHVGIYLGGGSLVHAPATGDVVKVSTVNWGKVVGVSRPG
jgi:peptidoglycan DL-endopeptidase CwlO